MTIHIVKKGQIVLNKAPIVYCGRGSALGNPYPMSGEDMRDQVCDDYEKWFISHLNHPEHDLFHQQLSKIEKLAREGDVNLQCYCAPKRCHTETIRKYVESKLLAEK